MAISVDPVAVNADLAATLGIAYPLLSDADLRVIDAYGVRHAGGGPAGDLARPATFLIDREGNVAWRDLTDNWRIRVRPERVLEHLAALP